MKTNRKAMEPAEGMSDDDLQTSRDARAGRFGVEVLETGGSLTFPKGYPTRLEDYADPVNLKYPLTPVSRLRNALARFAQAKDAYTDRSRRIVFSRIVSRSLAEGVEVAKEGPLLALLAPDLQRRVEAQKGPAEKEAEIVKADVRRMVLKLDLAGGTVEDLNEKLRRAVHEAEEAGAFGGEMEASPFSVGDQTLKSCCYAYVIQVSEDRVVVRAHPGWPHDGTCIKYFSCSWKRVPDGVEISGVREVRQTVTWEPVAQGDGKSYKVTKDDGADGAEGGSGDVLAEKMDLGGGTLEDLCWKIRAVAFSAAAAGAFGEPPKPESGTWVDANEIGDGTILVRRWGRDEPERCYRAKWTLDDGEVELSNVVEVRRVEVYTDIGPGPKTPDAVFSSVEKAAPDAVETALSDLEKASKHPVDLGSIEAALGALAEAAEGLSRFNSGAKRKDLSRVLAEKGEDGRWQRYVPIAKMEAPLRTIWLEVYVPMERDTQGDWMTGTEIWKAMTYYMENAQRVDATHDFVERDVQVVECFQARKGDVDFSAGAWVLGLKINDDEVWKSVEEGEYRMVSMAGLAREIPGSLPPSELLT